MCSRLEPPEHLGDAARLVRIGGSGRPVVTSQNRHERVQMSPRIMIVSARRVQHSPMFGQLALSHTVWSWSSLTIARSSKNAGLVGSVRADPLGVAAPGRGLLADDGQVHARLIRLGHPGMDTPRRSGTRAELRWERNRPVRTRD